MQNTRLTGTAKHSGDMLAVDQPFMLTVHALAHTPGIVNTVMEFPTVHFNGATGQPTYPPMASGMLKKVKERKKLIAHVRDLLPANHPLVRVAAAGGGAGDLGRRARHGGGGQTGRKGQTFGQEG